MRLSNPLLRPSTPLSLLPIALAGQLFASADASAQELVTDRPDFTESAIVVPVGTTQVEGGFTRLEAGAAEESTAPELLVRWGVSRRFELRLGLPDYVDLDPGRSGLGDGSLGFKWQLGPSPTGWDVALIAGVTLPVGDEELTSDAFDPEVILTLGRQLARGWSLGTQAGLARRSEGRGEKDTLSATVVLGRGLTERLGTFLELAAEETDGEGESVLFHHGYTLLLRERLQLDLHAAWGLTDDAPDRLLGLGLSWRGPR